MEPPPIMTLFDPDREHHEITVECLKRLLPLHDFSMRYVKSGTQFYTRSKESYDILTKYMDYHDEEYYTFLPPWNKSKQIILKGIFTTDRETDIINDLAAKGFTCLKIDAIGERWHSKDSPIYLLELAEGTDLDEVKEIEVIRCEDIPMGIKWQDYKETRNRPIQCYRCQRYHHRSNYCHMIPQCVACGEQHWTKDCTKTDENPPKCVNCGGEHRADDRDCPEWIQYKERLSVTGEQNRYRREIRAMIDKQIAANRARAPKPAIEAKASTSTFEFPKEKLSGWTGFLDELKKK